MGVAVGARHHVDVPPHAVNRRGTSTNPSSPSFLIVPLYQIVWGGLAHVPDEGGTAQQAWHGSIRRHTVG
jgi:hypothetical protein